MAKALGFIDRLNRWLGRSTGFLAFFVAVAIVYEVFVRHFFNRPTVWANESTIFAAAAIYMLAGGWAILEDRHVRIDLFYHHCSPRTRAVVDCLTYPFFILYIGVMFWASVTYAWESLQLRETTMSPWNPPIYPMKILLAVGLFLIFLQGTARLIRNLYFLRNKTLP
jgi:TRAP-type mannitol/chloroaromatic compound transport system permease small subunit